MYKKILVGYDGSEGGERALSKAVELGKVLNSEICLITVVPPASAIVGEIVSPDVINSAAIIDSTKKKLSEISNKLLSEGFNAKYEVLSGDPADAILNYAETHNCDLIVLGRRRLSRFERLILGSVTSKVAGKTTKADVLVVP
ncbi:universal stress protein UspA-like protein [Caldisphaera lagunensis DSM 15908]|uniref:Universal stress protein UspA-like protein n=1 Tax=Caldisphaera lagunensis (strain DSM 15908 / JCM 11604 / ANMR 0165 / IC-154) TaxID=1056495 RepID=L0ABZ0_CALLD|nr:universal stress protein [Caldisphaera lagunensis]AFZ70565.1 universal stress protein UspA-like protein [Caldisphaera lagunensis DSM 15908]